MNDDNRASAETESTTEESSSTTLTDEVSGETSQRNDVLAELEDMTPLEISEWSTIKEAAEENPDIFFDDKYSQVTDALAASYNANTRMFAQCQNELGELNVAYNPVLKKIRERGDEIEREENEEETEDRGPAEVEKPDREVYWDEVEEVVLRNFGQDALNTLEATCANMLSLVFTDIENSPMLFLEGSSGAGKSLVIKLTEGTNIVVRVDDVTSASFVSHGGIEDDEEEGANDLLPLITHRNMSIREMGPMFSGNKEDIEELWSVLAGVGDGDGRQKATGNQGLRGYTGDHTFALQGATTYLKPHAWNAMGTVGGRVLFHEYDRDPNRAEYRANQYDHDKTETERFEETEEVVNNFLRTVWHEIADGYGSVNWRNTEWRSEDVDDWRSDNEDTEKATVILAELIAKARTPASRGEEASWNVGWEEVADRLIDQLQNINKTSALMKGREKVTMDDVAISARCALSTCPKKRRPYVKWVMDTEFEGDSIELSEMIQYTGDPEAECMRYMELIDGVGLGTFKNDGTRDSPVWKLYRDKTFTNVWETGLEFPEGMYEDLRNGRGESNY
ncbi:hypothetical protein PM022_10625 [Halorubrum ezzemoulense]|uniref:hypothetical protein n=1 Tax=Halorubrum ezzemoulense TaxID=337243 RepID=UPI00232ED47B|nr:hypothetical protein [Halorubrum ezzemoulense]MDB2274996.1 hypothetical protein [Halorubrum ezzemoulense]